MFAIVGWFVCEESVAVLHEIKINVYTRFNKGFNAIQMIPSVENAVGYTAFK